MSCLRLLVHHVARIERVLGGALMSYDSTERAIPVIRFSNAVGRVHHPVKPPGLAAIKDHVILKKRIFLKRSSSACRVHCQPLIVAVVVRKVVGWTWLVISQE
jgi:hypothetical protein